MDKADRELLIYIAWQTGVAINRQIGVGKLQITRNLILHYFAFQFFISYHRPYTPLL